MTTSAKFFTRSVSGRAELVVHGEIDASNTEELHDAISQAGAGHGICIVDLTKTDYLDSAGINAIFRVQRDLARLGIRLHLVAPMGSCPRYALNLVCAHDIVPVHDGIAKARAAIAADGP